FAAGKGIAALRGRRLGAAEVDRLDLEIPRLGFPFDVSGGVSRFQSRRCIVRAAGFSVSEEALGEVLAARLPRGESRVHAREGYLSLAGRVAWREGEAVDLTARIYIDPSHGRTALAVLDDIRVYGVAPAPAPLLPRALLASAPIPPAAQGAVRSLGVS